MTAQVVPDQLAEHIADAGDPHAAAGYLKEGEGGGGGGGPHAATHAVGGSDPVSAGSIDAEPEGAVAAHAGAVDPHPGYLTPAEGNAAYEALGAVAAHAGAANPHPVYLTQAEGDALYEALGAVAAHAAAADPHPTYLTSAEGDAKIAAHEALANPHPTYETSAEAQAKVDVHAAVDISDAHPGTIDTADIADGAVTIPKLSFDPATQAELDAHAATPHGGGGGGAPTDAEYVTLSANATLSAEAVLGTAVVMTGTEGARPAAATAGRLYFATDTLRLFRDTGAAWVLVSAQTLSELAGSVTDAQIPAGIARDAEVAAAVTTHEGAGDPHPGYLTPAEGNAAYEALGAVAAHAALGDPHPTYLTQAEGDARYGQLAADNAWAEDQSFAKGFQVTGKRDALSEGRKVAAYIAPGANDVDGLQIRRNSNAYGVGATANLLAILKEGSDPDINTLVLAHINEWGGGGAQTWHVRPGVNQPNLAADYNPTQAFWIETHLNIPAAIIDRHADAPGWSSSYLMVRDRSSGTYTLVEVDSTGVLKSRKSFDAAGRATTDVTAILRAIASQTARLLSARDSSDVELTYMTPAGALVFTKDMASNIGRLTLQANASQTANLLLALASDGTTVFSRINKAGYLITAKQAAPADGDLSAGELALWFDPTNGDAYTRWKGKTADGTVVEGRAPLGPSAAGELALYTGKAGAIPASAAADQADFLVVVPYAMKLKRLKATAKTAPGANTTFQIRRSTDNGANFNDAFGTVTINNGAKTGTADPADLDVNEGDILGFSVTAGGGSGADVLIGIVGRAR